MTSDQLVAKETPPHDPIQARPTLPGFKSTDGGLVVVFCDVAHFLTQHLFHERRLDFGEFPNAERPAAPYCGYRGSKRATCVLRCASYEQTSPAPGPQSKLTNRIFLELPTVAT